MEQPLIHYEFINSQTGTIIGYLSLPADLTADQRLAELKRKQMEVAVTNRLYIGLVYWKIEEQ